MTDDPENLRDDEAAAVGGPRVGVWTVVGVVAVVALVSWWIWPSIAGHDEQLDVLVAGDEFLTGATRSVELRVREEGWSVGWSTAVTSWCDDPGALADELERRDPQRVVLSFTAGAGDPACVDAMLDAATATDADVVVVAQPGVGPDPVATARDGVDVADPSRLVGSPGAAGSLPCEWWEECETGATEVRGPDGTLTEAGGERMARVVVATLRG